MKTIVNLKRAMALGGLALIGALGQPGAHAQTPPPTLVKAQYFREHYYEVYAHNGVDWQTAADHASTLIRSGTQAHLATITSAAEDEFLETLRQSARTSGLGRDEVYVGGSQPPSSSATDGWEWENGEGSIAGTNAGPGYANWLGGEPNDAGGGESYLAIGLGGNFGWNDEAALGNIGGYIVEYDLPILVSDCQDANGCETIPGGGQTLKLPPGLPAGATITAQRYDFTDPRVANGRCGLDPLTLFGDNGDPNDDLVIPPYLCGSPDFVVVVIERENFEILQGTVLVENDVLDVLPDNDYRCELTLDNDPQHRDVVVWQATNPAGMLETSVGSSSAVDSVFEGSAGEYTNECINPSRGIVKSGSYFAVGLHIDFGQTYASNANFVFDKFVALTRYKLLMLRAAVNAAYADRSITRGAHTALSALATAAIVALDRDRYVVSRVAVRAFYLLARATRFKSVPGKNHNGELLSRSSNLDFTLYEKVIPYAP